MEKSQKVTLLAAIVLVGFSVTVIFHYIMGFYLHLDYPADTFLCNPKLAFNDFTSTMLKIKNFAPYHHYDSWVNYFPLAYILWFPFSFIKNRLIGYLIFATGFMAFLTSMNVKFLSTKNLSKMANFRNIFIMTLLSYPVLYILDRGNFDMFLLILFAGFIYAFKSKKYFLSAVLIGIENAIKPFPALFLILFLFKRKYKELFLSLIISALLIVGGFMLLNGRFFDQISVYIINLAKFKKLWVDTDNGAALIDSSSLFAGLKFLLCYSGKVISVQTLERFYSCISFIITSAVIFFVYREKVYWKKVTLLTLQMLLMPYIIIDYKLIFLYVPIWLFLNSEEKTAFDAAYAVLFGLLLFSKKMFSYFDLTGGTIGFVSLGVMVNPIIMLTFMGLIISEQFRKAQNKQED